jgi:geranylgeranyl pyrophosphate synthase
MAAEDEQQKLFSIFGNTGVAQADIEYIRSLVLAHGIFDYIQALLAALAEKCRKEIVALKAPHPEKKEILMQFLDFSLHRGS